MPTNVSTLAIRRNNGEGAFETLPTIPIPFPNSAVVQIQGGDLDGDGDFDAVLYLRTPGAPLEYAIATNSGSGTFLVGSLQLLPRLGASIALADLDQDGDLDLVVSSAYLAAPVEAFANDGTNTFAPSRLLPANAGGAPGFTPVLGDFNHDGRDDILALGTGHYFYLSSPSGYVDASAALPPGLQPATQWVGDFDGDGHNDLLLTSGNPLPHELLVGDGAGGFARAATPFTESLHLAQPHAADIDKDGDLDFIALAYQPLNLSDELRVFVNDGSGQFTDESASRTAGHSAIRMYVTAGDVDGDGDTDLYLGSGFWGGRNRLLANWDTQIQLQAPLQLGSVAGLEFARKPGYGVGTGIGIAVVGTKLSPPAPTPFGPLHVHSASAITLPFALIPSPLGSATSTISVPNNPALTGLQMVFQGIVTDTQGTAPLHVTNFIRATIG